MGKSPGPTHDDDQKLMGLRLKEAREVLGLTQEQAAAALGVQRTSVTSMEQGKRNVSASELAKLSNIYRRSVEWLLGREESSTVEGSALLRATKGLSDSDKEKVLRFAQFLADAGPAPEPRS